MPVSFVFRGGPVLTQRRVGEEAEALAVEGDRIVAVGRVGEVSALAGASTRIVELEGRALLPGFVDAHAHLVAWSVSLLRLDVAHCRDRDELLFDVRERAKLTPGDGWIVGHSWDESTWSDATLPDLAALDAVSGDHPVLLSRVDRHGGLVNAHALQRAGLDPTKHVSGLVTEVDFAKVVDACTPSLPTKAKALDRGFSKANTLGVTSAGVIARGDDGPALAKMGERATVRAFLYYETGAERATPAANVANRGVKLYADGSLGSRTAALSSPYADAPSERGALVTSPAEIAQAADAAARLGEQAAFHAIGDIAVDAVLTAFEKARFPRDARPRIEHMEMFDATHAKRLKALGGVASVQPNFTATWGHAGQMYEKRLGRERALGLNRLRLLADAHVAMGFGGDDVPLDPLFGVRGAVEGPTPAHRLTVDEALYAHTAGAAFACKAEKRIGSLAPGLAADLVVLSTDPRHTLAEAKVDLTFFEGKLVHERRPP